MKFVLFITILYTLPGSAAFDLGIGSSSITSGRPAPALAINWSSSTWGALYRSVGVQTAVYAQNAWTIAAYKPIATEKLGPITNEIGAGLGGAYILRTYRFTGNADITTERDYAIGPHLTLKLSYGAFYLGFDTLLGLTSKVVQHLVLNFQDVSHTTLGISF